ncbi:MAG: nucleotidyltransferase family protein [Elusimicrobiales bacterium]
MNSVLARNILLLGALEEIGPAAAEKDLRFLLLKGSALLTQGVYGPREREMTDLDLLVRSADETGFIALLAQLKFRPMENSSQAYYRPASRSAPPVIVDLHTGLWHEKKIEALWQRAERSSPDTKAPVPAFEDQFLHLASHTLLYHGCLDEKTQADLAALLAFVYGKTGRPDFWRKTAALAAGGGLRPVIYPALKRLAAARPELMSEPELMLFAPRGAEKIKSRFFEKAAAGHSRPLEYLLPGLYRPSLFLRYLFPDKRFLESRYGRSSWTNRFIRPFQLLHAVLNKEAD